MHCQGQGAGRKARHLSRLPRRWPSAGHNREGIILNKHLNLVAIDFIGGDSAKGSIPCLEDDDRDHERGGEGSTHVVDAKACASLRDICLGSCWEARDHPPR